MTIIRDENKIFINIIFYLFIFYLLQTSVVRGSGRHPLRFIVGMVRQASSEGVIDILYVSSLGWSGKSRPREGPTSSTFHRWDGQASVFRENGLHPLRFIVGMVRQASKVLQIRHKRRDKGFYAVGGFSLDTLFCISNIRFILPQPLRTVAGLGTASQCPWQL